MKREKQDHQVLLNGKVWYSYLTETKAVEEAMRARKVGLGMAYVERMENRNKKQRRSR